MAWTKAPIKTVMNGFWDGPHATPKDSENGPVYLGIKNINEDGSLNLSEIKHIAEEDFGTWTKRVTPSPGDIVFTYEATLNRYAIIPQGFRGCLGRRLALIRPDVTKVDHRFLFYSFFGKKWRDTIAKFMIRGSTVDRIPIIDFPDFEIEIPNLATQHKIADILSSYDDLIENNTRRIRILEEMAQAIYREWFVNFRFPGHETVRMVESSMGRIPEGWELLPVRDIASYINRGISPKYDENATSWVINQKCIRNNSLNPEPARRHSTKVNSEKLIRFGDILINSTGVGTLGRVAQVYMKLPDYCVDSHVTIVRPNDRVTIDYFGFVLISLQDYFDRMGMGATNQTELGRESVAKADFILPPFSLQAKFSDFVSPLRKSIINFQKRIGNLRKQRDLLLPKLLSGELNIENLNVDVEL